MLAAPSRQPVAACPEAGFVLPGFVPLPVAFRRGCGILPADISIRVPPIAMGRADKESGAAGDRPRRHPARRGEGRCLESASCLAAGRQGGKPCPAPSGRWRPGLPIRAHPLRSWYNCYRESAPVRCRYDANWRYIKAGPARGSGAGRKPTPVRTARRRGQRRPHVSKEDRR